jgi:hypothetical protein
MGWCPMKPGILDPEDQSALPYPRNAQQIVAARAAGMKPAGPVMVVMTRRYETLPGDAHVFADPGKRYRWDWVRGLLSVVVVIDASTKFGDLLHEIQLNSPNELDLVDCERMKGWKVCITCPQLRTVRWPDWEVKDWLSDGEWHADLQRIKEKSECK